MFFDNQSVTGSLKFILQKNLYIFKEVLRVLHGSFRLI